jgi:hypothetical protein
MNTHEWGNAIDFRLCFMKLEPGIVRSRLKAYSFHELNVTEGPKYNDVNLDADGYGDGPGFTRRRTSPR